MVTGCALRHPAYDGGADDVVGADVTRDADAGDDVADAADATDATDVGDASDVADVADVGDDADAGDVADAEDVADAGDVADAADAGDVADVRDVTDASDVTADASDATVDASDAAVDAVDASDAMDVVDVVDARDAADAADDAMDAMPDSAVDAPADVATDVAVDVSYTMATVSPAATSVCSSAPALRNDLGAWVYTGNTAAGGLHDYSRGGCNVGGTDQNELVYSLSLSDTRRVFLAVESTQGGRGYNPVLYVSRTCDPRTSRVDGTREQEVACVDDVGSSRNPSMNLVLPAGTYRVFVDGDDLGGSLPDGKGSFRLLVRIEEPDTRGRVEVVASGACPTWSTAPSAVPSTAGDDTVSGVLTMPFVMRWYGAEVSTYAVSSNGIVMLNPSPPSAEWRNQAVPGSVAPNGVLAPWWDDLITDSIGAGGVTSAVMGASPSRVFAVRWNNVSRYNDALTRATFEARLYETTNVVEFHYCGFSSVGATLDRATIGVESVDGLDGVIYALNQNLVRAGQILRFTPP